MAEWYPGKFIKKVLGEKIRAQEEFETLLFPDGSITFFNDSVRFIFYGEKYDEDRIMSREAAKRLLDEFYIERLEKDLVVLKEASRRLAFP